MLNLIDTLKAKSFNLFKRFLKQYYWYRLKKLQYLNNFLAKYWTWMFHYRYNHIHYLTEVYLTAWEEV